MRALALGLVTALMMSGMAFAADPVGHYSVKGTSPNGGSDYSGDVTVQKTGDTYSVVWTIGDTKFIGTGVGNDEFLTVSYKSGDNTGLALYGHDAEGWTGVWTYAGGKTLGTEKWVRD